MKPAPFTYHAPRTVSEALALLAELGGEGKVLAGGQSLIPILNMRLSSPAHLVDINRLLELDTLEVNPPDDVVDFAGVPVTDAVRVGALVRHSQAETDQRVRRQCPLLARALRLVAHPAIRNRGTVCGALAHADPSGELPAALVLLEGTVEVARAGRPPRPIPARDFFIGPMESALEAGDLVVAARFPVIPPGTGTEFTEVARRSGDYALCGVAAMVGIEAGGEVSSARVACSSVSPTPLLLDVSEALAGARPEDADYPAAGRLVREAVTPEADIHASAEYRRELAAALTERALATAASRAAVPR